MLLFTILFVVLLHEHYWSNTGLGFQNLFPSRGREDTKVMGFISLLMSPIITGNVSLLAHLLNLSAISTQIGDRLAQCLAIFIGGWGRRDAHFWCSEWPQLSAFKFPSSRGCIVR